MTTPDLPPHDAWQAWKPHELAERLRNVKAPWCIAGGWALDLWHGRQTRDHEDIEFTIIRSDLPIFRKALFPLQFCTASSGIIELLPAHREPRPDVFQIWCLDTAEHCWRTDMMLEPGGADMWVCRRDARISRPRGEVFAITPDGVPYLKPAIVLLFKAKHMRAKDKADFAGALPRMEASEKEWLKRCLDLVHPGHPWIGALQG